MTRTERRALLLGTAMAVCLFSFPALDYTSVAIAMGMNVRTDTWAEGAVILLLLVVSVLTGKVRASGKGRQVLLMGGLTTVMFFIFGIVAPQVGTFVVAFPALLFMALLGGTTYGLLVTD